MLKITTSSKVLRRVSFWIQHDWILGVTKWQLVAHLSAPYLTWFRWVYTNIKMINSSCYKNVNIHLLTLFVVHSGTTDWEAVTLINPMIRRWMLPEFWRLTPPQLYDSWVNCLPNTWQKKLNILWRNYLNQTDLMWLISGELGAGRGISSNWRCFRREYDITSFRVMMKHTSCLMMLNIEMFDPIS